MEDRFDLDREVRRMKRRVAIMTAVRIAFWIAVGYLAGEVLLRL